MTQEAVQQFCEVTGSDEGSALRYIHATGGDCAAAIGMYFAAMDGDDAGGLPNAPPQMGGLQQPSMQQPLNAGRPDRRIDLDRPSAFACIRRLQEAEEQEQAQEEQEQAPVQEQRAQENQVEDGNEGRNQEGREEEPQQQQQQHQEAEGGHLEHPGRHGEEQRCEEAGTETIGGSASSSAGGGSILSSFGKLISEVVHTFTGIATEDFDGYFEGEYGLPKPPLSDLNYSDAIQAALQERRLAVLWLHDTSSEHADALCVQILQDAHVLDILWRSCIVIGADVCRFEPAQLASILQIRKFPALVILEPQRNGFDEMHLLEWPLGVFAKPLQRIVPTDAGFDVENALASISVCVAEVNARRFEVEQAREAQRIAAQQDRLLREQQDAAYEESLLRDQLQQLEAANAAAAVSAEEGSAGNGSTVPAAGGDDVQTDEPQPKHDQTAESDAEAQATLERRQEAAKRFLEAKAPAESGVRCKIVVKLPTGRRVERSFEAETQMREVYAWVDCAGEIARLEEGAPFEIPKDFELSTAFPRKVLSDQDATLSELGLLPGAALMLKELEEAHA